MCLVGLRQDFFSAVFEKEGRKIKLKAQIMDEDAMKRALMRISHQIAERNKGVENVVLVGILRRGKPLADMIQRNILEIENISLPCGSIDISFYRDDLSKKSDMPQLNNTSIGFNIDDKDLILIDDVIYTGRTARAAIDAVFSIGRPRSIQLAELIDRGHRELPIRPDYVGKNIPSSKTEQIEVRISEYDGETGVYLLGRD